MRRLSLVLLALAPMMLAGCDALRDAFSTRTPVVARANDQTLSVERLGGWAGSSKQVPIDPATLSRVSRYWVEYALFADALASGRNLRDSALVVSAMWPAMSQLKIRRLHDRRAANYKLSPPEVDSAYKAGPYRVFQHILFRVTPPAGNDSTAAKHADAQKRRQAEQILTQARTAGARFGQLASRYSDDPGTKTTGGSLGLSPRGQYLQEFDQAAWQLEPGAVSPLVKTVYGYHIIRRPPLAEVRDSFRVGLESRLMREVDSLYTDSLLIRKKVQPVGRAPAYAKAAVQDVDGARSSNRVLVTYRGGALTVRNLARWLDAMDPQIPNALPQARDEEINQFLKGVAQEQIMLEQADSAGVTLTPEDWAHVRANYDSTITMITSLINLTPEMLRDSTLRSPERRTQLALDRVNDYFDRVFHNRARFYPLPAFLADTLLAQAHWNVDEVGVRRAVERGQSIRADSTQASGAPRMAPAPGPPPIDTTRKRTSR